MQQAVARRRHWTLDDIPWGRFDASKVDPEILKVVKAAAMVEHNGGDYGTYLCGVFHDDPQFQGVALGWAEEEVQHGRALAAWARLADPGFDFEAAFKRFTEGFKIPVGASASIRGSRVGELVARCIVETGTSSYYTALKDACEEPVLKEICRNIAADEHRHYKLFYDHLRRYLKAERVGRLRRLLVALQRMRESEDDELAYAYYAANEGGGVRYDRRRYSAAYARRAYGFYRPRHVERGVAMALKAAGLPSNGRLNAWLTRLGCRFLAGRSRRLAAAGA
ncbi:MAG TPA: ferritin-like domain-containing protein [Dongiaceae bacterium]|nr:ferritin-like domain-containing protein [Dongiaceae bacterium]